MTDSDLIFLPISEHLKRVESLLDTEIKKSNIPLIREAAKYIIAGGGKRFRPALTVLSAKICGYSGKNAAKLAASIELIHTASLIHDDVLDSADTRRGSLSANVKWGNHLSVLVGDYCLSVATSLLTSCGNDMIYPVITNATSVTTEGELMEVIHCNDLSINEETYKKIIGSKTAELFAAACHAGSLLAEATPKLAESLKCYGRNFGMAFQIIDDILDYTSVEGSRGKSRGMDLKEGKLTLPLIYALKRCGSEEKEIIKESLLSPSHSGEHFQYIVNILRKYHCVDDAGNAAEEYVKKAKESLKEFKPSLEKESLIKVADYILRGRDGEDCK